MKRNFTLNDVLLYHYNELTSIERAAFEHQLEFDEALQAEDRKIRQMQYLLDGEKVKPSSSSVQLIMGYNRQSSGELEIC